MTSKEPQLKKEIEELDTRIQEHNKKMINSTMQSNHEELLFEYNRLANLERVKRAELKGIQETKSDFEGDLLRKDNHILGCMLECYSNILEFRGFKEEARQIYGIASRIK